MTSKEYIKFIFKNMGREIKVNKLELIRKIKENKENHIKDYHEAVENYKIQAKKQLDAQLKALEEGSLEIEIKLVTPQNKTDEYDKIISMFDWEHEDFVTLSQSEFNHYVLDEAPFAMQAKFLNSTYRG